MKILHKAFLVYILTFLRVWLEYQTPFNLCQNQHQYIESNKFIENKTKNAFKYSSKMNIGFSFYYFSYMYVSYVCFIKQALRVQ